MYYFTTYRKYLFKTVMRTYIISRLIVILRVGGGGTIIALKTTYIYITFIFSCYGSRSVTAIFHNNYISMHVLDGVSHLHIK